VSDESGGLAQRIKSARGVLGYSQREFAEAIGSKFRSLQDYERGLKMPGGQVFVGLVGMGFNANWLLTGKGPMLLAELGRPLDKHVLGDCIACLERALLREHREMAPDKKARILTLLYELYSETGAEVEEGAVVSFIRERDSA
jgi:transcriptional regulator with XRE-family HTH domain